MIRAFTGKMNLDTQEYRIAPGDYVDALNITRNAQGEGQDRIVSNLVGNQLVSYTLPSGTNKRIGSRQDPVRNRIYYFIWNSNDYDTILYYDRSNNTINKLLINLTDTSGIDILNFNPSYKINHIDIIYRDEGDLLFWTDGLNRPMVLNVQDAIDEVYGTSWLLEYLTVNRVMPLIAPTCSYEDDASVSINNLRKKLYQLKYRYVYKDFTKSCWSPISKLFAPSNPDSIATDIDPTKNNRIDVIVETGAADCVKIEIAARQSITTTFSDFFLITTLDKEELSIDDNSFYTYEFFNDSSYPYIDILESLLLYSNVPRKAYAQSLPNGNIITYGAITEGYDYDEVQDVTSEVALISNAGVPSLSYQTSVFGWRFEDPNPKQYHGTQALFTGDISLVTSVTIVMSYTLSSILFTYTSTYVYSGGDTIQDMVEYFRDDINTTAVGFNSYSSTDNDLDNTIPANTVGITADNILFVGDLSLSITINSSSTSVSDVNISAFKQRARYSFGRVYFDEYGETDGVHYQPESMNLLMPELNTTGGSQMSIPQITFTVNDQPPSWAKTFSWVRSTNLTFGSSVALVSFGTLKDNNNQYAYINITNLQTNQSGFSAYEYTQGDRVRIIGLFIPGNTGTVAENDFPISDLLTNPTINGSVQNGSFLKIPYNSALSGFGTTNPNYYIEIYTPAPNTDSKQQVFYEFGENYPILNPGESNRAHGGQTQDQIIGTQPAIYIFTRGDYYIRTRLYNTVGTTFQTSWVMSQSVSDLYPSQVQSIGRAFVIDADAKETYFPTLVRFGQDFQQSTDINRTNIFFPDNFDEYDRSNGDIRKLFIEGRRMYVFQKFDIGVVPILTQIVRDTAGNPLEANSDILLNKIAYPYQGKFGIGDCPESFAYHDRAKYGVDDNKGVAWRLSQDGITELSVLYECNAFFTAKLKAYRKDLNNGYAAPGETYTGDPSVYGCFDFYTNKYIVALEEINRYNSQNYLTFHQDPYTLVFNETRDSTEGFECFTSYHPEGMESLGTLLVSFKDGALWTHDSETYNQFYGTNYESYITGVFNDNPLLKKSWMAIEESSNVIWDCPEIISQVNSYGSTPQQTNLNAGEFLPLEGQFSAAIKRDANSTGGKINGSFMKGAWLKVKFRVQNASNFVFLNTVNIRTTVSQLNSV